MPVAAEIIAVPPVAEMEQRVRSLRPDLRRISATIANTHGKLVTAAIKHGAALDGLVAGTFYSAMDIVTGAGSLLSGKNALTTAAGLSDDVAYVAVLMAPQMVSKTVRAAKEIASRLPALAQDVQQSFRATQKAVARMIESPRSSWAAAAIAAQLVMMPVLQKEFPDMSGSLPVATPGTRVAALAATPLTPR